MPEQGNEAFTMVILSYLYIPKVQSLGLFDAIKVFTGFKELQSQIEPDMQVSSKPLKQRCPWPSFGSDVGSPDPSPQEPAQEQGTVGGGIFPPVFSDGLPARKKEIQCKTWPITLYPCAFIRALQFTVMGWFMVVKSARRAVGQGAAICTRGAGQGRKASRLTGLNKSVLDEWERTR